MDTQASTLDVGRIVKMLSNEISRCISSKVSANGLPVTHTQGLIIGYLFRDGAEPCIFQRDIEKSFHIRRSTASEILNAMEKNGLIVRTSVPEDARLKRLVLTDKARDIYKAIYKHIRFVEDEMLTGISLQDLEGFYRTADGIRRNLRLMSSVSSSCKNTERTDNNA